MSLTYEKNQHLITHFESGGEFKFVYTQPATIPILRLPNWQDDNFDQTILCVLPNKEPLRYLQN